MSYEILGSTGQYWSCHQCAWRHYLKIAIAFGWVPEGAFFKCDEVGFGEHPSGSYSGNDWQIVTDDDARAMAAALNLAVATINARSPMTDEQATVLNEFKFDKREPFWKTLLTEGQRVGLLKIEADYVAMHPDEIRTIRTGYGTFDVNVRPIMDLADVAGAGGFIIA
jgi:hypothetical protein